MNKERQIIEMKENSYIHKGRRVLRGKYKGRYCYQFSWFIWNLYNSDNKIKKGDGNVIHHINKNSLYDRIENLKKMTSREHSSLHNKGRNNKGKDNPMFGKENKWGNHKEETKIKMSESKKGYWKNVKLGLGLVKRKEYK